MSDARVPVAAIAAHVGRSVATIYTDAKLGLIRLQKTRGVRGSTASVNEVNRYIKKKFFGKPLITEPANP